MANLRMVVDNYVDASVITATPALNSTLPSPLDEDNLKVISRAKVTRSTSSASQDIDGIFNSDKTVSAVIIGRHNLPLNTTYRIQLFSDNAWSVSVHDSGTLTVDSTQIGSDLWAWGDFLWGNTAWGADRQIEAFSPKANLVHWLSTAVTARSFRITIAIASGSYLEIGRLIIGEYIEPTYNTSYGHNITWPEDTKQYRTDAGTLRSDISLPNRRFEFDIGTMTESDRTTIQNALRKVGLRKDFFLSLFPEDSSSDKIIDYSGIVKLTKIPSYTEYAPKYYKSKYVMEEV